MKKTFLLALSAFGLCLAACSDGVHPAHIGGTSPGEGVIPAVVPPVIVAFEADQETVDYGGKALLSYEVTGADKVEITSSSEKSPLNFVTDSAFKSSALAENIVEDTTYILTATKYPPKPEAAEGEKKPEVKKEETKGEEKPAAETAPAQPAVVTRAVTVKVNVASINFEIEFYATPSSDGKYGVDVEGKAVLQWKVVPESARVEIASSAGDKPVNIPCDTVSVAKAESEEGSVPEVYSSEGCASVQPAVNTTYTLTASVEGKEPKTASLEIVVGEAPAIEYFKVNGKEAGDEVALPAQVTLSWSVTPESAKVTIEPRVKQEELLPYNSDETSGSRAVTVDVETEFTLTAVVEGYEPATRSVRVSQPKVVLSCEQLAPRVGSAPVFVGETVLLRWKVPAGVQVGAVTVRSGDAGLGLGEGSAGSLAMRTTGASVYDAVFAVGAQQLVCPFGVTAVRLEQGHEGKAVSVKKMDEATVYVGMEKETFAGGALLVLEYSPAGSAIHHDLNFYDGTSFTKGGQLFPAPFMEKTIKTFPVNAVTRASDGRKFVGTTGAIVYEKGEGKVETLEPLFHWDSKKVYTGEHESCFGETQSGLKPSNGKIVSLNRVCDLEMTPEGRLYIASDNGLLTIRNTDEFIGGGSAVVGYGNPLDGSVVNDIEIMAGAGLVYAGGARGLYQSPDQGESWEQAGDENIQGAVYSIAFGLAGAVDQAAVVIGTEGSVCNNAEGTWACSRIEGTTKVYDVAVDPKAANVVYAATDNGFYVSRNGGESFADATPVLTQDGMAVLRPVVRGIAVIHTDTRYEVYLATHEGVMAAQVEKAPEPVAAPEDPQPAEEPPAEAPAEGFEASATVSG